MERKKLNGVLPVNRCFNVVKDGQTNSGISILGYAELQR